MATPYEELPENTFDYETDWKEAIGDTAPSSVTLSQDAQEATVVGYVPWNKQRSAARHFLGFAYADDAAPWRLHRELPAAHPGYPWLYAETISFTPYVPKSNEDHDTLSPVVQGEFDDALKEAYYTHVVATVRYRNFRCLFIDDDSITDASGEWRRWAYLDLDPKIEALQVTGGLSQLTFAEGGGANQPGAGTTPFGAPLAALLSKTGFSLVWMDVPFDYLSSNPFVFFPTKILACAGTVNSESLFDGLFPAGTMLLQSPQFTEKRFPVPSSSVGALPLRSVTVRLNWEFFDPERGATAENGSTTIDPSETRGHNLMPWSGNGTTVGDGKFYLATRGGGVAGARLVNETDHNTVFEHVNS